MISKWHWLAARLSRQLWIRASLFVVLGVAAALLSLAFEPFVPDALAEHISADTVVEILKIVASSMLAVTTFSLTAMVSAYSGATSTLTPRAVQLLIDDSTAQVSASNPNLARVYPTFLIVSRTTLVNSFEPVLVISPAITTSPVVRRVSQATLPVGSCARIASTIPSET